MTNDELKATPVGFAVSVLGLELYPWQADVLNELELTPRQRVKVTLATPNGAGKSERIVATACLWWLSIYPKGKVVITTKSGMQLDTQIAPAIESHRSKFDGWKFIERQIETPTGGLAVMFTTDDAGRAEGHHTIGSVDVGPVLIIVDEAKSVESAIFEALDRCTWTALLYVSSPGSMSGRFYESHTNPVFGFKVFKAGLSDCPHIPKDKIDDIIKRYGADAPYTRSTLHGEFMLADGESKFDREGLEYLAQMANDGYGKGVIGRLEKSDVFGNVQFHPDPDGWLWLDEDRKEGCSYMISCDPNKCEQAEGTKNRDNTACAVLRDAYLSSDGQEMKEQVVACMHDQRDGKNPGVKWDSDVVASRMKLLSDYFGRCTAVIEENNFGSALIKECQKEGVPLWRRTKTDDVNPNKILRIVGYSSSAKTREWWVQKCSVAIRDKSLVCRYKPATDEFATFIVTPSGRSEAIAGKHDDWVACIGIAMVVRCYSPMPRIQRYRAVASGIGYGDGYSGNAAKGSGAFG
jgi:hypothetical protein